MKPKKTFLIAILLAAISALPSAAIFEPPEKAQVTLESARTEYAPGQPFEVDILIEVDRGWHVNSHRPTYEYLIPTDATVTLPDGWPTPEVIYPEGKMATFAFADEPLSVYEGQFVVEVRGQVPRSAALGTVPISIAVRYQACDDRSCLPPVTVSAETVVAIVEAAGAATTSQEAGSTEARLAPTPIEAQENKTGLIGFLVLGILGGLLLNAMPCVLPVLSLKLMGLVKSSGKSRGAVSVGSLATAAGILVSFWALAGAAIAAKAAGASVGWGIQFQQPVFVTALTFVVALFCLNLWGLFEVPLPSRLAGWADATGGEGLPSHFSAGLFATLLATPCSAPFLGTAVGFALGQTAPVILAIFSAVGLGMALPYFFLALAPGTIKLLPKPGSWMDHFRFFMGFLLAAAAVWLLYVLSSQVSRERLATIELALLCLALFIWIRHRATQAPPSRGWRVIGVAGAITATVLGLLFASQATPPNQGTGNVGPKRLISWVPFDRTEALELAANGHLVFVDVTADWCFTCKVNERLVLETEPVAAAFDQHQVIAMKADWTNRDDSISAFLAEHGKYGIPFYLLYRPDQPPHLFSEILTQEAVVTALDQAASPSDRAQLGAGF